MKKIYATLMAFAAALMLIPVASAQEPNREKYIAYPTKGVGLNKYLKSTEPNDDGEYTLRLETFLTGSVSTHAIPTDFVLVLDSSGSMIYDCLFNKARPDKVTKTQNETEGTEENPNEYYQYLRPAHPAFRTLHHYTYTHGYNTGNIGDTMTSTSEDVNGYTAWQYFADEDNDGCSLYYYYAPDQTYYRILKEKVNNYRRLYITTADNIKRYVSCTQSGSTVTTRLTTTPPTNINADNKIILIGYAGDNIYRPMSRREALIDGVDAFIDAIAEHNANDNFADGVTKHQVAIVAFANGLANGENLTEVTTPGSGSRVVKRFKEINATTQTDYKSALSTYFTFRGDTFIYYGMRLARLLLDELQGQSGMAPLNNQNGVNRNKVVVVFTDGQPGTTPTNRLTNVRQTLEQANAVKAVRTVYTGNQINGKVFSIDLSGALQPKIFLEHLSSNYSSSSVTSSDNSDMSKFNYSGTQITPAEDRIFYMDANAGGLEDAFKAIVDANTGDTSEHMVAVDVINDSFTLPVDITDPGRVKIYTAQCVGIKTIDGEQYLAFTDDVPVGSRDALEEIWFNGLDSQGRVTWEKKEGYDVDANITCSINGKQLVFKGFDFANLWCGTDDDENHHNTQQITEGMKNYAVRDAKYRGFKLVAEFPIAVAEDAVGGPDVPTNKVDLSGLFPSDEQGNPGSDAIVNYPEPILTIPIKLVIQKTGLNQGESASFTIEQKLASSTTAPWTEFTTFVLTGNESATDIPEIRFINLDPRYHYRVKETGWSWAYENADPDFIPSTETGIANPIVFENDPQDGPKHAEAKAVNKMRKTASQTITVYDKTK